MEWTVLDTSTAAITHAYRSTKTQSTTTLSLEGTKYKYPRARTIYTSMLILKQWFQSANVSIHYRGLEKLQKVNGRRNIIAPNHPSLFDSLVLRLLFYIGGQTTQFTPAVLALSKIPLLAKLMKQNGAFFIDSKRITNPAYQKEVNSFMRAVADRGDWLQLYFEGARTPNERQRAPRISLLSALADEPCAFFPISISYEHIVTSYLKGVGTVYIDIGDPILSEPLDDITVLAANLGEAVQRGVTVFTTDLIATLLLAKPEGSAIDLKLLEEEVEWLRAILVSREMNYAPVPLPTAFSYLGLKRNVPNKNSPEALNLFYHRERIIHGLYDLANPPEFIAKEFAWTPPPPLLEDRRLYELASGAITPLVEMYSALITLLDQGVNTLPALTQVIVIPPLTTQMLHNTLRILSAQHVLKVEGDIVTLN